MPLHSRLDRRPETGQVFNRHEVAPCHARVPSGHPEVQISEKRIRIVIVGIMLSLFLAAVESTVVATAMPTIVADVGGLATYSWVFTAYMLASTTTVPLYGKLSDLYGRRRLYFLSMTIFLTGSVLSGPIG